MHLVATKFCGSNWRFVAETASDKCTSSNRCGGRDKKSKTIPSTPASPILCSCRTLPTDVVQPQSPQLAEPVIFRSIGSIAILSPSPLGGGRRHSPGLYPKQCMALSKEGRIKRVCQRRLSVLSGEPLSPASVITDPVWSSFHNRRFPFTFLVLYSELGSPLETLSICCVCVGFFCLFGFFFGGGNEHCLE